jgi:hypothetical protein
MTIYLLRSRVVGLKERYAGRNEEEAVRALEHVLEHIDDWISDWDRTRLRAEKKINERRKAIAKYDEERKQRNA